jgi:16S rRNA (cytosine967-C5)-methyltransferase
MTPSARLQATIEILSELERTSAPADRFIRDWFRKRRYAGSKDRAAVAERVFAILRHRSFLAWRVQSGEPRALVMASVLAETSDIADIEKLFSSEGYGPARLIDQERANLSAPPQGMPALSVLGEFPGWLEQELKRSIGEHLLDEMRAMCERAPIDLRVNTLKATRSEMLEELRDLGIAAEPASYAPHGIRIFAGEKLSQLSRSAAFVAGRFEFQDEAGQIAALLAAPEPGQSVLDIAAGAGGKALALAASMENRGELLACDIDTQRLERLKPRAARAGASIIRTELVNGGPPKGPFDIVFVDAPCSGTGTWRRQPELKWRLTPERLEELMAWQDTLLDQAADRAAARIVYATCSVLVCENEARVEAFLTRHPAFAVRPAAEIWSAMDGTPMKGMGSYFRASPLSTGTDGFFTAIVERRNSEHVLPR